MQNLVADVCVIGAGSTGSVVASRLSEDPTRRVLLIEAGPDFPNERAEPPGFLSSGNVHAGGGVGGGAPTPDLDWGYRSDPIPELGSRSVRLRAGRLVGGGSMINGCIAVRGRPEDFTLWERAGATGWGWADVLPYYERVENEIAIATYQRDRWLPVQTLFAEGMEQLGYRYEPDLNRPDAWGRVVGPWPQNRRNELRQGTLVNYIRKARGRANFAIHDRSLVDRVHIQSRRVTGVSGTRDGEAFFVHTALVVVSAGAYGSSPILQRSGIGPATVLRELSIDLIEDLPVGTNVMQHPKVSFPIHLPGGLARLGGPAFAVAARGEDFWAFALPIDEQESLGAVSIHLSSLGGTGSVRVRSADPSQPPLIDHLYREYLVNGEFDSSWSMFLGLVDTPVFRRAGVRVAGDNVSLRQVMQESLGQGGHQAGGCSIGRVVDVDLKVLGIEGLRVADASVFPVHVSNNPNMTCFMVGEYLAAKMASR